MNIRLVPELWRLVGGCRYLVWEQTVVEASYHSHLPSSSVYRHCTALRHYLLHYLYCPDDSYARCDSSALHGFYRLVTKSKVFHKPNHRTGLFSIFLALSQTPAYTTTPRIQSGASALWCVPVYVQAFAGIQCAYTYEGMARLSWPEWLGYTLRQYTHKWSPISVLTRLSREQQMNHC